jgi:CheY-like chemotaxis protein
MPTTVEESRPARVDMGQTPATPGEFQRIASDVGRFPAEVGVLLHCFTASADPNFQGAPMVARCTGSHTGVMENARPEACTSVFIAEDSAVVRQRLAAMMSEIPGVSVVGEARTAADAIDGILRTRPTWVLLDIHLGESNGLEVLRRLGGRIPGTSFIVLTAYDTPQYRRTCIQAGASHFFDKTQVMAVKDIIAGSRSAPLSECHATKD